MAKATAIATGGAGALYRVTTNAVICEGIGHAIALETGGAAVATWRRCNFTQARLAAMMGRRGTESALDLRVAMQHIMTGKVGILWRGRVLERAVEQLQALLVGGRHVRVRGTELPARIRSWWQPTARRRC